MRLPIRIENKSTLKVIRMKQVPVKKKRSDKKFDTIAETISFVIKGKLTPIKTSPISRKTIVKKKNFKVLKKNEKVKLAAPKIVKTKRCVTQDEGEPKKKVAKKNLVVKTKGKETKYKQKIPKEKQNLKPKMTVNRRNLAGNTKETITNELSKAKTKVKNNKVEIKPKTIKVKSVQKQTKSKPIKNIKGESEKLDIILPENKNDNKEIRSSVEEKKKKLQVIRKKRITLPKITKNKVKSRVAVSKYKDNKNLLVNAPKRHRVASLNALAKVHCLYENETRNLLDNLDNVIDDKPIIKDDEEVLPTRTLRSVPGLRAIGKHWDLDDPTSSSDDNDICETKKESSEESQKDSDVKRVKKRRRRNRTEITMDLKDMVVRKRMASLNATAILAASYCVEKRAMRSPKSDDLDSDTDSSMKQPKEEQQDIKTEDDKSVIEVCATPNKKVAVILNQDTDVTITGVYVNSTTRSTHHEGYCSIAGMQYRISATSHTQTAATAVASETVLQSSAGNGTSSVSSDAVPCKSYTPLDALSSMQPPGGGNGQHNMSLSATPHIPPQHIIPQRNTDVSPLERHGCSSAFSAPPNGPFGSPGLKHPPSAHGEQAYPHGYYQPAGPLINLPHGHVQPPLVKGAPISDLTSTSPLPTGIHPPAPSSTGDSSDNEVIITSVTTAKEPLPPQQPPPHYRLNQYHPPPHHGYSYSYPPQYYAVPPSPAYAHHDLCYPPSAYLHHKYSPSSYRRYLPNTQYYQHNTPPELFNPATVPNQQTQQVVSASAGTVEANAFRPPQNAAPLLETYPPQSSTTLIETYPPHYYPAYGPVPPPSCFTHSAPARTIPYMNAAAYQSCPCPMQSCPKNVHTGPLTGESKRSTISSIAKESLPLPPVASLALPLEPASATGPPSPARGSAGMAPPPSPAGATYQSGMTPKLETSEVEFKRRKARIGKTMVRNNMAAANNQRNTMLLMCHSPENNYISNVKREVESPKEVQEVQKKDPMEVESSEKETTATTVENVVESRIPEDVKIEESSSTGAEENLQKIEPCQRTVAENVKVKNMKRKLVLKHVLESEAPCPVKQPKVEKVKPNGSYKDLIKKNPNTIKINNGKRKLNIEETKVDESESASKIRKRVQMKMRLMPVKEEDVSKPAVASNPPNSKPSLKELRRRSLMDDLVENKEPVGKTVNKRASRSTSNSKKALQEVQVKDSVDRTIDCVVSESCKNCTTERKQAAKMIVAKGWGVCKKKKGKKNEVIYLEVPMRSMQSPRWSNGWTWEGEPYPARVFINSDETMVVRWCYPKMRHKEGDIIEPRDCVLLKAGQKKNELPFVAKIAALWENPEDGEMMMSLLWYYRPEHTEQGRSPNDQPDEVFASRHKDSNSVACIEDKCFVLTFHEYCRFHKELKRLQEGIESIPCIPKPNCYPRLRRLPSSPLTTPSELIFYCRKVYDFRRKRIVENPG